MSIVDFTAKQKQRNVDRDWAIWFELYLDLTHEEREELADAMAVCEMGGSTKQRDELIQKYSFRAKRPDLLELAELN